MSNILWIKYILKEENLKIIHCDNSEVNKDIESEFSKQIEEIILNLYLQALHIRMAQ